MQQYFIAPPRQERPKAYWLQEGLTFVEAREVLAETKAYVSKHPERHYRTFDFIIREAQELIAWFEQEGVAA